MKEISILLTKYTDFTSNIIYLICGRGYTHVSIALEEEPEQYYSFNYRGFAFETIEKHRKRGVRVSRCYKIKVSDEAYAEIKTIVERFKSNRESYRYSKLGVLFCVLNIPVKMDKCYFCSQFVAELLEKSKTIKLPRKSCLFKPNHFIELLERHCEYTVIENIV